MSLRKRRGRLSAHKWTADWFAALRMAKWKSCTTGLPTHRKIIYPTHTDEHPLVDLSKKKVLVTLVAKEAHLELCEDTEFRLRKNAAYTHLIIIRGRPADQRRGIGKIDSEHATRLLSQAPTGKGIFLVEFEGALYEPIEGNRWKLTQNAQALAVYASYRQHSRHHHSIRSYRQKELLST